MISPTRRRHQPESVSVESSPLSLCGRRIRVSIGLLDDSASLSLSVSWSNPRLLVSLRRFRLPLDLLDNSAYLSLSTTAHSTFLSGPDVLIRMLVLKRAWTEGSYGVHREMSWTMSCSVAAVGVRHDFRYKPLVHDVLGLKKLDGSDPFWLENGSLEFPQVAEEIETQLNKYKKDLEEINMMRTGAYETDLIGNTKHLMNAVNSLSELKARKEMIDKHTNIATNLLGEIKERSLDVF
ncbi:hypothetical protein YC2023_043454 [Brassica napus]